MKCKGRGLMRRSEDPSPPTSVETLETKLGADWPAIREAKQNTEKWLTRLRTAFAEQLAPDTSLVVFGSLARQEMTKGSDTDWILLIDGQALPSHEQEQHTVAGILETLELAKPGPSGVFGCMVGSHDLVHKIGGEDDLNSNTTRRVLLLLESLAIGDNDAYDRVVRQILSRYLEDDYGLKSHRAPYKVPRFLLNDLTRYWRTVTVDFVYKQRTQAGKKWALRNAKLRMSRKLIFAAGLLRCFFCQLDDEAEAARDALKSPHPRLEKLLSYLEGQREQTPLGTLALAASLPGVSETTARGLFDSYDGFLAILDDDGKRRELEEMSTDERDISPIWQEVRDLSQNFQTHLTSLFFRESETMRTLTMEYGIF